MKKMLYREGTQTKIWGIDCEYKCVYSNDELNEAIDDGWVTSPELINKDYDPKAKLNAELTMEDLKIMAREYDVAIKNKGYERLLKDVLHAKKTANSKSTG